MADQATRVTYHDGTTPVLVGDDVQLRFFFRRTSGRVTYVPGVSRPHSEMEFGGLTWIGIKLKGDWLIKEIVDPDSGRLRKCVRFASRGATPVNEIKPSDVITE